MDRNPTSDLPQPRQRSSYTLAAWLASGVAVQASFVLLPIGNYSTLVYLLFYLPFLVVLCREFHLVRSLISRVDRPLAVLTTSLFLWVSTTTFWSGAEDRPIENVAKAAKHILLISSYLIGVGYLARHFPKLLRGALMASSAVVAAAALVSIYNQYVLDGLDWSLRLSVFGYEKYWRDQSNAVITGIYFGVHAVISSGLYVDSRSRGSRWAGFAALCTTICMIAVILTATRTALLGLVCTAGAYLLLSGKKRTLSGLVLAALGLLIYGVADESSYVHELLTRGGFGGVRPQIWLASLEESSSHVFTGSGLWHDFQLKIDSVEASAVQPHSHNFYLQLLSWTGVVGLSLYLGMLARLIALGYEYRELPLAKLAMMVVGYFVVVQIFDVYDVFTKPSYYWPCLWLPCGILAGVSTIPHADLQNSCPAPIHGNTVHTKP